MVLQDAELAKCEKCKSINKIPDKNSFATNRDDFIEQHENNFNIQVPYIVSHIKLCCFLFNFCASQIIEIYTVTICS